MKNSIIPQLTKFLIFYFQMIMPYSVSKTALLGLTKALSFELAPDNIRVNCIAPGIIDTKFAGAVSFKTTYLLTY